MRNPKTRLGRILEEFTLDRVLAVTQKERGIELELVTDDLPNVCSYRTERTAPRTYLVIGEASEYLDSR